MTLPTRLTGAVAVAATVTSLAIPGVAGAKAGDKTFQQTFPVASQLCAKVAAGKEGKHLKRFATQVLADCATLQSRFATAQSAVLASRAAITAQIASDRATIAAACPTPKQQPAACGHTRAINDRAIDILHHQSKRAARHYFRTIETARHRFWTAIRGLPGERRVHEDAPIAEQNS